jgi:hypothetical protein
VGVEQNPQPLGGILGRRTGCGQKSCRHQ